MRIIALALTVATLDIAGLLAQRQFPEPGQVKQERAEAELEVPYLVDVLRLKPGMTVADVGAGFGAHTVVLAKWIGDGRIFATDIAARQLTVIREYVESEGAKNVTVLEGGIAATNLPANCCEAILMRDVYHHITAPDVFDKSLFASVKPGGRLAIMDFVPTPASKLPAGVPENRGGHGIPTAVVEAELKAAGFRHLQTVDRWPRGNQQDLFLVLFEKP